VRTPIKSVSVCKWKGDGEKDVRYKRAYGGGSNIVRSVAKSYHLGATRVGCFICIYRGGVFLVIVIIIMIITALIAVV